MHTLGPDDPTQIGPYRLLKVLGEGGMGRVYLGHLNGTLVAVKVMVEKFAKDPSFRQRFRREMEAAEKIEGPFTVKILRTSTATETKLWFASEYVPGPTLAEAVQKARFTGVALEQLAYSMCEAQLAIHAGGVIHRDCKPSNIILGPDGARVIDFGVAYLEDAPNLTMTGEVIGTPNYMAPEQVNGGRPQQSWDVFALGSLLVFAATGRPPFTGLSAAAVMLAIGNPNVQPDLRGVPANMLPFIKRCLQHSPSQRARISDVQPLLPRTHTATAASTRWMPQPVTVQVQEATRVMTRLVQEVAPTRKETPLAATPASKPKPPTRKRGGASFVQAAGLVVALMCIVALLAAQPWKDDNAPGAAPTTGPKQGPTVNPSQPAHVEVPPPKFKVSKLKGRGDPKVTAVKVQGRNLLVTVKTNDEAKRNASYTGACLKTTHGDGTSTVTHPNERTENSEDNVIKFGGTLDFVGSVYFFPKCNKKPGATGSQWLGDNDVPNDGYITDKESVVPVIDAYTKGGKLLVVIPSYNDYTDKDYQALCLKTTAGAAKPTTLTYAENNDRPYVILAYKHTTGVLYMGCSRKGSKISYTGVGARIP